MYYNKGIDYSQDVAEELDRLIYRRCCAGHKAIEVYVDTFYNCREQGFVFTMLSDEFSIACKAWVYAQRNSDALEVAFDSEPYGCFTNGNIYPERAWRNSRQFKTCYDAANAIFNFFVDRL